jgi:hypothetical protein
MSNRTEYCEVWIRNDGRIVTVEGLRCKIKALTYDAIYPVAQSMTMVSLVPTRAARKTARYEESRRMLRDDWSFDALELDCEAYADVMRQLGE